MKTDGKVALVTGASGGIGLAIVRRLATSGYRVVAHYHRHAELLEPLQQEFGDRVLSDGADLRNPDEATQLVERASGRWGGLHVLIASAGATRDALLVTASSSDFQDLLALNYLSAVAAAQAAVRPMMRQKFGRIIFLSSVAAHVPGRGQSNYAGTKGALESFARALAVELGPKQITVNCVAPGVIDTAMSAGIRAMAENIILERTALGRYGAPSEVAAAVAFLASEEAAFITGHTLRVDGGFKLR